MASHSVFAWRIPWTGEPGGLQPMGSQGVGHDCATKHSTQHSNLASQIALVVNNQPANAVDARDAGALSITGLRRSSREGKWQTIPISLPEKFHGQEEPGRL